MRHLLILGVASIVFALMTAVAWQHDTDRAMQAQRDKQQAIDGRLLALEMEYLQGAQTLLTVIAGRWSSGGSPNAGSMASSPNELLDAIGNALAAFPDMQDNRAREMVFDNLEKRVRGVLLQHDPARFGDTVAQEWRRQTDRMNGVLHRRALLVEQAH